MSFDRSPPSGTPRSLPPPPAAASGQRNRSPFANPNASFNTSLDMNDSFHNPYGTRAPVSPTRMSPQRSDPFISSHASPVAAASPSRRSLFQSQESLLNNSSAINMSSTDYGDNARPLPLSPVRLFEPALASHDPFDDSQSVHTNLSSETVAAAQPTLFKSESNSAYDPADCGFNDDIEDYDGNSIFDQQTLSSGSEELPPATQPRRNKCFARKEVKLVRGNLVLDCPVPTKLYSFLPRRDADEFVYMRYSGVTSSPENFADSGFTIRPAIYDRHTELCVCITMYNEDEVLFTRTLHAVFKNIAYLCQRRKSKVWGPDSWKRIVVTVVADGRSKINPRVLDCLAAMGVFQDGVAKSYVNGEEVHAHMFEYTAQVSLTPDLKFQGAEKQMVPVQMIFCLKERNAKKINSHRWFFDALCPQIDPNVVVLLDVGTRPATQTLYHLWKAFDEDSNVGGACGEIKAMTGRFGKSLLNPLVAAQNFEYKMSNILDKPFESAFGYITVLPGALSAYRWRALQNNPDGTGPLASYFKGETLESSPDATIFEKNMYLAEDRILCWELVSKQNERWVLKYVKAAKGETDVPESLAEFISQRRRWLNGSLFASVYAQTHFRQIWRTSHSPVRKFFLHFEFIYHFFQLLFTFFSMANFYLAFYFVAGSVASNNSAAIPNGGGMALFLIFKYLLVCTICAQFVLSLGNRPQGSKILFTTSVVIFGCVTAYISAISFYFVARTFITSSDAATSLKTLLTMVVSLASTYGVYLVMSLLYFDPWHIFTSALQYFLLLPAYICTLQIYAFCNTHDVTWGTKGDNEPRSDLGSAVVKPNLGGSQVAEVDMPSDQIDIDTGYDNALHSLRDGQPVPPAPVNMSVLQTDYLREFRTRVVLVWMVCNLLLVMLVTQFVSLDTPANNVYLQIILWSMAVFAVVRSLGSLVYLAQLAVRNIHKSQVFASEVCSNVVSKVRNEPKDP